jgi:hypothetical protein
MPVTATSEGDLLITLRAIEQRKFSLALTRKKADQKETGYDDPVGHCTYGN